MLVGEARLAAGAWVARYAARRADFRGAFFSGSTTALSDDSDLPAASDVDVVVVVAGAAPDRRKLRYEGALLEITSLPWDQVASADEVEGSYFLAPSFATDQVIADPTGHLVALHRQIASRYGQPAAVRRRYEDVMARIEARPAALDTTAPWPDQVLAWLFPTSLTTQVVLVAALRPPTVRLRYLAARTALEDHGRASVYPALLELLGCADADRALVQRHLTGLAITFDQAAAVASTPFPFSTDITHAARPAAVAGTRGLAERGDHREAVFWIVATLARCQKILAADAPGALQRDAAQRFGAALRDLVGINDHDDLLNRRNDVLELLPDLRQVAASITAGATRYRQGSSFGPRRTSAREVGPPGFEPGHNGL